MKKSPYLFVIHKTKLIFNKKRKKAIKLSLIDLL